MKNKIKNFFNTNNVNTIYINKYIYICMYINL